MKNLLLGLTLLASISAFSGERNYEDKVVTLEPMSRSMDSISCLLKMDHMMNTLSTDIDYTKFHIRYENDNEQLVLSGINDDSALIIPTPELPFKIVIGAKDDGGYGSHKLTIDIADPNSKLEQCKKSGVFANLR